MNNAKSILGLVQNMEDPKASFNAKNEPKYLNKAVSKSEVKKAILATRVRQYIQRKSRLFSNMNKIYGIIWGQCTPRLQSVLKGN